MKGYRMKSVLKFLAILVVLLTMTPSIKSRCRGHRGHQRNYRSSFRHGYRGGWRPVFYGGYYDLSMYDSWCGYPYGYAPYLYEPVGCSFGFNFFLG